MPLHRLKIVVATVLGVVALGAPSAPASAAGSGVPIDISLKMTMDCITPGNAYLLGDCGDMLKSTYVEETVPKTGPVTVGSTLFRWPKMDLRTNDTMQSSGQTFALSGQKGFRSIALLAAYRSAGAGSAVGSIVVKYTDGTSERVSFRARDWKLAPEKSDIKGVRVQTFATVLFDEGSITKALAPINAKKGLKSITLPQTISPPLLVWAVSLSNEKAPAKV